METAAKPNSALPYVVSLVAGFAICLAVSAIGGRKEAWDSPLYFIVGIPLMCVVAFALAYRFPVRAWRWVAVMAIGQSAALLMAGGSLSLWPLTILAMVVLSLPQLAMAIVASNMAQRRRG